MVPNIFSGGQRIALKYFSFRLRGRRGRGQSGNGKCRDIEKTVEKIQPFLKGLPTD
jgi:hypothetical protein